MCVDTILSMKWFLKVWIALSLWSSVGADVAAPAEKFHSLPPCILSKPWSTRCLMLSRSGVAAVMGGTFGVTVMGGIVTLGNDGVNLGGETGSCFNASVGTCCFGWTVAR